MKDSHAPGSLGPLLQQVLPEPPLPAGFARSVLRRIHAHDERWKPAWLEALDFLRRPFALAVMSLALAVGAWDGLNHGMSEARMKAERTHVLAVDPESIAFTP